MLKTALIALVLGSPVMAEMVPRDTDVLLSKAELAQMLTGQELEYFTGGFATYDAEMRHTYRYEAQGERVAGDYTLTDQSTVCVTFDNGWERCDLMVKAGERLVTIVENGERYPVRMIRPIE